MYLYPPLPIIFTSSFHILLPTQILSILFSPSAVCYHCQPFSISVSNLYNFLNYCFSNYTPLNTREFNKSRVMRIVCVSGIYVPIFPCVNVPKACQLLIFTYQRASKRANVPKARPFFNFVCQKECQFFNYFSKENIFQFLTFSITLKICKFQEYLDNSRKFILRGKEYKFWNLQNLIKEMQNKFCRRRSL